jgi:two-component system phosphate regulon sensor histidine kinase PhoR
MREGRVVVIELRRVIAAVLLFVGMGVGLHLLLAPLRALDDAPAAKALTLGVGLALAVLGIVGGFLVARVPKERIAGVANHLDNLVRRGTVGLAISESEADSLGRLGHAINRYLTFVKDEVEQSHMAAKERQIQMKVLEAEKRHVEAVIHAISDGVLVTDAFGDLVLANAGAEQIFAFKFDPAVRRSVEESIRDERFLELINEMRETGLFVPHRTVEWVQGQGDAARTFRVILNTVVEGRKRDRLSGVVAVLHDVTREKEVARMKSDFVSNVSHELKAPLSSIRAYAEMLLDNEAADEAEEREFLGIIAGETDRLGRLIENILNLSRLESGLVPINKTDLAVTEILRDAADVMTPQAVKKNIRLEADLAPVFFRVNGDRDMLYQAVLNVVSNAVKYTPEGGQVRISTYLEDGAVVVDVADTGLGIPADDVGRIFDKFYRARHSARAASGTGLGLALVKHVIETVHGGRVAVETEVGKGSVFRLFLPAVR